MFRCAWSHKAKKADPPEYHVVLVVLRVLGGREGLHRTLQMYAETRELSLGSPLGSTRGHCENTHFATETTLHDGDRGDDGHGEGAHNFDYDACACDWDYTVRDDGEEKDWGYCG